MNLYDIEFLAVLPFRPNFKSFGVTMKYKKETWDTEFTFSLQEELFHNSFSKEYLKYQSIAIIKTKLPYNGNKEEAENYAQIRNPKDKVTELFLEKLNYFLDTTRYSGKDINGIEIIRNVGLLDFTFYNIRFEGNVIFSRGNLSLAGNRDGAPSLKLIKSKIPNEWNILSKAEALINHGFPSEGLLVGFALLDHLVQNFIKEKLQLTDNEKNEILRSIERKRLSIYLGSLSKIVLGKSILEIDNVEDGLRWLNTKRNEIMHNGDNCNVDEAEKGLNIILKILNILNDFDANLELPTKIMIW